MDGPFAEGTSVAWIEDDPQGLRVFRAEVTGMSQATVDTWVVETTHGREVVDGRGEGAQLVPIDAEIAEIFAERGDGFLVEPTTRDISRDPEIERDWGIDR